MLEVIKAFEKENNVQLNYIIGSKRDGDVVAIYANNNKAKDLLKWIPTLTIKDMVKTAWLWELSLQSQSQ